MPDQFNKPTQFVDGGDPCVAVIRMDRADTLVVTACNDRFLLMSGAETVGVATFPILFDTLFPASVENGFREALRHCFRLADIDVAERKVDFCDGKRDWRLSLKPIKNADTPSDVLVTGIAMRAPSEMLPEVGPNTSRYRALVDLAYDAIVTMDQQHNITLFNRAAESLFGYTAAEVLGRPVVTLLPEKFRAAHPRKVQNFSDSYQPKVRQATPPKMDDSNSVFGRHRNGSTIPVEIAVSKIDLHGATEFMAVVRDITDRAQLMTLLKTQASTDALTGIPNRRGFLEFVGKALETEAMLSVFILDIDFFKRINDNHGHDAGDEVLRALANVGQAMTYQPHLFARWGGEEFVAALPGADATVALEIAEALRLQFARQAFVHPWPTESIPFTVSIGLVTRVEGEDSVEAMMKRADRALYRAKQGGRNRVESG
jgi:diguanylate cyclase (GGDEF)-like protein/PAS domain S-box-containing protein